MRRFLLALPIVVAACAEGTGGPALFTPDDYLDESLRIARLLSQTGATDLDTLPTRGTVDYIGIAQMTMVRTGTTDQTALGRLDLELNLRTDRADGSISRLFDREDNRFLGSLRVSDGRLDRDAILSPVFSADLDGAITDGRGTRFTIDAEMTGALQGDDGELMVGDIAGTHRQTFGPGGNLTGAFVAEARD